MKKLVIAALALSLGGCSTFEAIESNLASPTTKSSAVRANSASSRSQYHCVVHALSRSAISDCATLLEEIRRVSEPARHPTALASALQSIRYTGTPKVAELGRMGERPRLYWIV